MEIKFNREIRNYNETMFFGLSMRQFFFSIAAIGIAIGISSYRNQFVSKELLPPDWKNEDLKNCPFISNVDFVVEQYAALLRVELCKFYINKLLPNVEGVVY